MPRLLAATLLASATTAAFVTLSAGGLQLAPAGGVAQTPPTLSREEIALAADRIRADRWYDDTTRQEGLTALRVKAGVDMELLLLALKQPFPELRAAALREFGRFELAQNAALIATFLGDPVDIVQRAAADALVQTLWDKSVADAALAVEALEHRALQERSVGMLVAFWTAIAELPLDVETARKYETRFVTEIRSVTPLRFGALEALLSLTEHRRGRPLMADTEQRVMNWARAGLSQGNFDVMLGTDSLGRTIRYLEILQAAQADADDIAIAAATFFCRKVPIGFDVGAGCGFDIRRLGVELLNPANPAHVPTLLSAARERGDISAAAAAIRKLIQSPDVTRCRLLELAQQTPAEPDVIAALENDVSERKRECGDWSPEVWMTDRAQSLVSATRGSDWIGPAAALRSLAKRAPDKAKAIANDVAVEHVQWHVRVAAADVAAESKDVDLAMRLVKDTHPNVRAAALVALHRIGSLRRWGATFEAIRGQDDYLVLTAASLLKGIPASPELLPQLFAALRGFTQRSADTSRRVRLALLDRIAEMMPEDVNEALPFTTVLTGLLRDFDPVVAKAAAAILQKHSVSPVEARPTYRPALQPTAERLRTLPPCVVMTLVGEGTIVVVLNRAIAPVAVARFLNAASHYRDSTIFRDDENLTVFGNPAENDEGGWGRFARDEPGARIGRGSLTMLNHGPDTADGRLGIRWRANPELDRRATLIGRVDSGPDLSLGKQIKTIEPGGYRRNSPNTIDPCDPSRPW